MFSIFPSVLEKKNLLEHVFIKYTYLFDNYIYNVYVHYMVLGCLGINTEQVSGIRLDLSSLSYVDEWFSHCIDFIVRQIIHDRFHKISCFIVF